MSENAPVPVKKEVKKPDRYARARQQIKAVVIEFSKETDRACVIIAAARVDYLLSQILTKYLIPCTGSQDDLLDSDRALGTFSARIHAVFRLGLIDAEFARALHLLRKMRNAFAHEAATANLEQPSHRDRVREIIAPLLSFEAFEDFKDKVIKNKSGIAADFCTGVSIMISRLEGLLEDIKSIIQKTVFGYVPPMWTVSKKT
ncbi:MAG: hypothetical protein H8E14_12075 [Candidatus Marinimicrobia bacterium]|nr:hypothetical protein [Candidatus Neomarinimicrobiota bacterium]